MASLTAPQETSTTFRNIRNDLSRLSTGVSVSTDPDVQAASDAATQKIEELMRDNEQIRQQIASATHVLETAQEGLEKLRGITTDLRKLSMLAADSTVSSEERIQLGRRFSEVLAEYSSVVSNTTVSNVSVLDGSYAQYQVRTGKGASSGDVMTIAIDDFRADNIGQIASAVSGSRTAQAVSSPQLNLPNPTGISINDIAISGLSADGISNRESSESMLAYMNAINAQSGVTGVTAEMGTNKKVVDYSAGVGLSNFASMSINGTVVKSGGSPGVAVGNNAQAQVLVNRINAQISDTGVSALFDASAKTITLEASDGRNIDVAISGQANLNVFNMTGASTNGAAVYRGTFRLISETKSFKVTGAAAEFLSSDSANFVSKSTTSLAAMDLASSNSAKVTLNTLNRVSAKIGRGLEHISGKLTELQKTAEIMNTRAQNYSSATAKVFDILSAAEQATLTKRIVISDATATIVAQANVSSDVARRLI